MNEVLGGVGGGGTSVFRGRANFNLGGGEREEGVSENVVKFALFGGLVMRMMRFFS